MIGAVLIGGFYDLAAIPPWRQRVRRRPRARVTDPTLTGRRPPLLVVHGGADNEAPIEQARRYCSSVAARRPMRDGRGRGREPSQRELVAEPVALQAARSSTGSSRSPSRAGVDARPLEGAFRKTSSTVRRRSSKLDAFLPQSDRAVPAVIVVHGGGWEAGDKVTYVTPLFEPLARAGLAWFSIDYRLTPAFTHEDQLEDLRQAIRFVRAEHARFNIDPARIFLVGESASGQMVTQIAAEDRALAGVVSFYGVYDFTAMVTDASPRSLLVRLFRRTVLDDESRAVLRSIRRCTARTRTCRRCCWSTAPASGCGRRPRRSRERLTELGVQARSHRARRGAARDGELGRAPRVDGLQKAAGRVDSGILTVQEFTQFTRSIVHQFASSPLRSCG